MLSLAGDLLQPYPKDVTRSFFYDIEEKTTENSETRENADSVLAGNEGNMKNAGKAENVAILMVPSHQI